MSRSTLDDNESQFDTWANLPSAATNQYRVITVTGVANSPIDFTSNGTEWVPVNGQCTLEIDGTPYGIMPSGTMGTGASGHFVSGTALPHTYSVGIWMYFAATAVITPALSAGFYWCIFSNTTTCTIYQSGPGSSAYNFSVGGGTTGATTEITTRTVTIPANLMGAQGQLSADLNVSIPGNTNTKTVRHKLGGTNVTAGSTASATALGILGNALTANTTSAVQISKGSFSTATSTVAPARTAIDTTAATTYVQSLQMAVATDYIISNSFRVDLYNV